MNLRRLSTTLALATLVAGSGALATAADIRRLATADAHTIVLAKKNDERAYQAEYLADAWKTFQDERICERVFDIVASRAPQDKLDQLKDAWAEIETALEPISLEALGEGEEFMMFNVMVGPFGQTVAAVRLTEEDAKDYRQGVGNLFELVQKWVNDESSVHVESSEASGAEITTLGVPEKSPYQPAVACVGDIFIISTSEALLKRSLAQLEDESTPSKFDDERFKEALSHLPEPEDAVTFFDADQLFKSMAGLGDFIRAEADEDDKENAERGAKLIERIIDEINVIQYETVVEYTEDGQNRVAALGKISDDIDGKLLGRAITHGEEFKDWQSWVPADATAYSLSTGIYLHELYVGVLEFVREEVPEAREHLDKWAALQEKVGVNVDEDILQSFSGESVSITFADQNEVSALKCTNEAKIRELLNLAITNLKQIPQVAAQGIDLVDVDDAALEGFQEIKMAALAMSPFKPVIGFRDGWMIIGSSPEAAKTLLAVRAGDEPSIEGAESLERFDLKTEGAVSAVSYSDVGAGIRAVADAIDQMAMMAPFVTAAATADASEADKKTLSEVIGLLPSISKVIRKFDFFEQKLSITRQGPIEGSYIREAVQLIRQPEEATQVELEAASN
jgi:hypothetical protein